MIRMAHQRISDKWQRPKYTSAKVFRKTSEDENISMKNTSTKTEE